MTNDAFGEPEGVYIVFVKNMYMRRGLKVSFVRTERGRPPESGNCRNFVQCNYYVCRFC